MGQIVDSRIDLITTQSPNESKILEKAIVESRKEEEEPKDEYSLWRFPCEKSCIKQILWIITWPVHLIFFLTIPDCEKTRFRNLFPLTFMMCIVWIGSLSYLVAWMITIIGNAQITSKILNFQLYRIKFFTGDTLKIPDSVMGITFLAAGTSVPEAVSSVIVAKQGMSTVFHLLSSIYFLLRLIQCQFFYSK